MSLPTEPVQWTKQSQSNSFLISTDRSLLSIPALNAAFASDYMYWLKAYPEEILQGIIDSSFCLGLHKVQSPSKTAAEINTKSTSLEQIGFARLVTDNYTFGYLTDVYVLPEYQGLGLGGWILDCVDELVAPLPHLRWFILRTAEAKSVQSYQRRLEMDILDNGDYTKGGVFMGKKGAGLTLKLNSGGNSSDS
ncbi:hypothetical protein BJX99DRAFT_205256 [Aspergillus californicus]